MRYLKKFFILLCLGTWTLGLWSQPSYAEDQTFEATVDSNQISLGAATQLRLTFKGGKPDEVPKLPVIDGFESSYVGPTSNITIYNSQVSSTVSHVFSLFPMKEGKFQIPAISVSVGGKTMTSQPIDIEVVQGSAPGGSVGTATEPAPLASIKEKIFMTLETPKKEVYLNEKVPVTIKLFVNGLAVNDIQYPQFLHNGFSKTEFEKPKQYKQNIGGVAYDIVEFNTNVYPSREGELDLGPAQLLCNLIFQSSNQRRAAGQSEFFDDDFFNGFFNNYQKKTITVNSADLKIKVVSLPEEGKPADFSGAVGKFDFNATASPLDVTVGDPVTVRMSVTGEGYLPAVKLPVFTETEKFKVYDPEIKEENGVKTSDLVIIPRSEELTEIPPIAFNFFNPETKSYQTLTRGPFPVKVHRSADAESSAPLPQPTPQTPTSAPTVQKPAAPEKFGQDIVFIKDQPGSLRKLGSHLYKNPFLIFLQILLLVGWIGLAVFYRYQQRMQSDVVYARRLLAPKKAHKGIEQARQNLESGRGKEFYDTVFRTLQEYLGNKLHLSSGAVTLDGIEKEFQKHRIGLDSLQKIKTVFTECDMVRYASHPSDFSKMQVVLKRVEEIIDDLERHWK